MDTLTMFTRLSEGDSATTSAEIRNHEHFYCVNNSYLD